MTPQVSKKMRTGRGLEQLKQTAQVDIDKAMEELEGVEGKLKEEPTDEWKDIKSSHSWKLLRRKRCNWFFYVREASAQCDLLLLHKHTK